MLGAGGGGGGIADGGGGRGGIELVVAIVVIKGSDDADVGVCFCGDIISGTSLEVWLAIGLVVIGWLIFSVAIGVGVVAIGGGVVAIVAGGVGGSDAATTCVRGLDASGPKTSV